MIVSACCAGMFVHKKSSVFTIDYFMVDLIIKTNSKNEDSVKMTL